MMPRIAGPSSMAKGEAVRERFVAGPNRAVVAGSSYGFRNARHGSNPGNGIDGASMAVVVRAGARARVSGGYRRGRSADCAEDGRVQDAAAGGVGRDAWFGLSGSMD